MHNVGRVFIFVITNKIYVQPCSTEGIRTLLTGAAMVWFEVFIWKDPADPETDNDNWQRIGPYAGSEETLYAGIIYDFMQCLEYPTTFDSGAYLLTVEIIERIMILVAANQCQNWFALGEVKNPEPNPRLQEEILRTLTKARELAQQGLQVYVYSNA